MIPSWCQFSLSIHPTVLNNIPATSKLVSIISLQDLTKDFGDFRAIDGVNLEVEQGEIFGFLGPNGAGKSTTINVLLDLIRPTSGSARIFDIDCQKGSQLIRQRTGVLPEGFEVYGRLTGRRHMEFAIEAKDADVTPDELLERVGLLHAADRPAGGYSTGMKQRLGLANALIGGPDLLMLDEPHSGLDPNGVRELLEVIREENEKGTTVFFSSHILDHVQSICDRVCILNEGEIMVTDTIDGLRSSLGVSGQIMFDLPEVTDESIALIEDLPYTQDVDVADRRISVTCQNSDKAKIVNALVESKLDIQNIETTELSLDDVFAAYTSDDVDTADIFADEADVEDSEVPVEP